jgi:hypothetical protein
MTLADDNNYLDATKYIFGVKADANDSQSTGHTRKTLEEIPEFYASSRNILCSQSDFAQQRTNDVAKQFAAEYPLRVLHPNINRVYSEIIDYLPSILIHYF